jgi:hypothetical protein
VIRRSLCLAWLWLLAFSEDRAVWTVPWTAMPLCKYQKLVSRVVLPKNRAPQTLPACSWEMTTGAVK